MLWLVEEHILNFADAQEAYDFVRSKRTKKIQQLSMMQGKVYQNPILVKNPILVLARNAAMRYTNIPGNDLKRIHDYDSHDEMQTFRSDIATARAQPSFLRR